MKGLILASLVGFILAIALAIPFTQDEAMAFNNELGEIRNDVTRSNLESQDYNDEVDTDDNEEDEENQFEDEDDEEDGDDDEDEEDDDNDDDEEDNLDEGERSNPIQQSSDPAWGVLPFVRVRRVVRGARRLARRFRRRHRGRRVGRWIRRRRNRG